MDMLKKFFPLSWKFQGDVKNLVIAILIYVFGGAVIDIILAITIIGAILAPIVSLYSLAGIVISILLFAGVIKDEPAAETKEEAPAEEANDESTKD